MKMKKMASPLAWPVCAH